MSNITYLLFSDCTSLSMIISRVQLQQMASLQILSLKQRRARGYISILMEMKNYSELYIGHKPQPTFLPPCHPCETLSWDLWVSGVSGPWGVGASPGKRCSLRLLLPSPLLRQLPGSDSEVSSRLNITVPSAHLP